MIQREAIILAGGLGTRLRERIPDLPKVMAPVGSRPFLSYLIDSLSKWKVDHIILSLGYKHEVIESYIRDHFYLANINFSVETSPLGTGGAIRLACEQLKTEQVCILNGDTFFNVNLLQLESFHMAKKAECSLALKPMEKFSRYGTVELNQQERVIAFHEKKYKAEGLINGGVYFLDAGLFKTLNWPEKFSFETDYLYPYCQSRSFFGLIQDQYFIDIGIPEDYEKAEKDFTRFEEIAKSHGNS